MPLFGFLNPLEDVHKFDPDKNIPRLAGKVIIVTGGNSGCGKETILQLAKHTPGCIYLAARTKEKYDDAMQAIAAVAPSANVKFMELDLGSLESVKKAAQTFLSENDRLDCLINNAGIMAHPHSVTKEGYEVQFGTNHMGHALLTRLLLPLMEKTTSQPDADVRIVNVSSVAHTMTPRVGISFPELKTEMKSWNPGRLYAQSKLANVLHARELARRHPNILSVSIHPGRVETNLSNVIFEANNFNGKFQRFFDFVAGPMNVQQGALTQIWAATWNRDEVKNGAYYTPVGKENAGAKLSQDVELAKKLWDWTENELESLGY